MERFQHFLDEKSVLTTRIYFWKIDMWASLLGPLEYIFTNKEAKFSRRILRERNQSMGHFLPSQKHSFLKVDERQSNWFWATTIEMLYRPLDIPILVLEGKLSR